MDDVLSRNDLRDDEIAEWYLQLQNWYLAFKEQLNTRTRPEEIISTVRSRLNIKHTRFFDSNRAAFSTPLNPSNVTPKLTQAAISQKPEKESFSLSPPLNPSFLTPPPTAENPSQGPKRKRRRIQFVNYLDDHNAHSKQRKRTRHKKFRVKPFKYTMGEEED